MCPVYTPDKSPPKLDKFCYLSHPAQRVMIALYKDFIQKKQDLLRCLAPVVPVDQNYYQTLYRSRFGSSPTINVDSHQHSRHPEYGSNLCGELASVEKTPISDGVDPSSWIPSDTSSYSDSPPIETQGYRFLSQFNQQDSDTSLDTLNSSDDDTLLENRYLKHGHFQTSTFDVEYNLKESANDKDISFNGSQSLFSQDGNEINVDSSVPVKAQPRKHTNTNRIKKCHQMKNIYEKLSIKKFDGGYDKPKHLEKDSTVEARASIPIKPGIPESSITRIDCAGDKNSMPYSIHANKEKVHTFYNEDMNQHPNPSTQNILDERFKKMAVDSLVQREAGDVWKNNDELLSYIESPFLEEKERMFPIFAGEKSFQKGQEKRCEEQDQKVSDKRKKSMPGTNFTVPFKRPKLISTNQKESFKDGHLLNIDSLPTDQLNQLLSDILKYEEVIIVLLYKDGSTQLRDILFGNEDQKSNRCKSKQSHVEVDGLALTSRFSPHRQVFTFPVKCQHFNKIKDFWDHLLRGQTRKIGFQVKETLTTIMKIYKFDCHKVDMSWTILDPAVGQWLLDSDNPSSNFEEVLHAVSLPKQVPSNDCLDVLNEDMMLLGKAMEKIIQKLKNKGMLDLYLCIETKLVNLLASMEMRKLHIATHTLIKFSEILKKKLKKLEQKAHQTAGHTFLLNSHTQLRQVLFEELHLDARLPQKTKLAKTNVGREKSTSETVLTQLAPFHELPGIILEYRQLQKLKSTYIDGILSCIKNETLTTHWDQTAAATGRLTSYQPNIQAIPKQPVTISSYQDNYIADKEVDDTVEIFARDAFVSQQGYSFVSADFQQIELRLLAHLADDPILIQNFTDPNNPDIFNALTAQWLGKPVEEVTSTDREQTKRVVYSVMYGAGKEKLAEYLKITPESAKAIISSFLNKFPSVSQFSKKCVDYCKKNGYTSSIFNRRRSFPNINHPSAWLRAQAERQCVNFCIQGSAADICKAAMIQIENELATDTNIHAQLLIQIHDELLLEVEDGDIQSAIEIIQKVMQSQDQLCGSMVKLRVPIPVSVSMGKTWGQMKNM